MIQSAWCRYVVGSRFVELWNIVQYIIATQHCKLAIHRHCLRRRDTYTVLCELLRVSRTILSSMRNKICCIHSLLAIHINAKLCFNVKQFQHSAKVKIAVQYCHIANNNLQFLYTKLLSRSMQLIFARNSLQQCLMWFIVLVPEYEYCFLSLPQINICFTECSIRVWLVMICLRNNCFLMTLLTARPDVLPLLVFMAQMGIDSNYSAMFTQVPLRFLMHLIKNEVRRL